MLSPETILQSRYRVVKQLGQGGMGAVYEALDERLDTTVALKETLFTDERLRKQFEREARLLARMHHPALPRVSDHFSEGEGQFLVMQYIAGDDLAQMMHVKRGPFPLDQVLTWGDQLLDALDYLHTQDPQIIHRDIKPQNLKLTSRGQIILLDFGLAKGQTGGVSMVTTSASIFGYTPNYAPLEQIQGLGTDPRSDIYALSATLYHLMTGVKPPDALTRAAALVNGQPDPLVPASHVNNSIGPLVSEVLARAMSQNRDQRYSTAAAMREAFKGNSEAATLTGRAEAASMLFEPPASTLVTASAQPVSQPVTRQPISTPGETTVVQPRRRSLLPWSVAAAAVIICVVFGSFYAFRRLRNSAAETPPVNSEQQNSTVAEPASDASSEPVAGDLNDDKDAEAESQRAEPPEKKIESHTKQEASARTSTKQTVPPSTPAQPETVAAPKDTQEEAFIKQKDIEALERLGNRRRLNPAIRTLPDGTKVVVNPDGSRVLIGPSGASRVLRPGQRINRRKAAPYP